MRQLSHPAIIQLHSFSESTDHYFLKLELMEGGELFHQIVKLTYFSEDLSRWVVRQVAEGIKYLHNVGGVVHRDIKPENLLFSSIPIVPNPNPIHRPYDEDKMDEGIFIPGVGGGGIGRVKIADFGLSKIIWDEETGTPCGTVGYTAPEIVKDERYSTGVDMWALGCVLYTVLCGFPPFYDESINVLTEKVARGYYTFLSPWWDDISSSSKDLITHLLDVNPERRYNIDQFLEHPWMRQPDPPAPDTSALKALPPALRQRVHHDSPLLAEQAGGFRSPGLASLKEAFDVTYAVHRMEEEGKRRRAGGRAGFGTQLNEVDEEEEDEDEIEATKRKYGAEVARGLQEKSRAIREGIAAAPKQSVAEQQRAAREYPGWGGADRKQAERELYDGRAGQRDRGTAGRRRGAAFELNINNATLLGKRKQGIGKSPLANQVPVNS
ncbi:Pkinase-domain-containing protein [Atractiella rhizophila]|nr:Pkinase-domain-containing protein [Atractiella rhizophila]